MRAGANRLPELLDGSHALSGQHCTNRRDLLVRQRREVRQRSFADLLALTIGLTEKIGGARSAVRNAVDMHGHIMTYWQLMVKHILDKYMATY